MAWSHLLLMPRCVFIYCPRALGSYSNISNMSVLQDFGRAINNRYLSADLVEFVVDTQEQQEERDHASSDVQQMIVKTKKKDKGKEKLHEDDESEQADGTTVSYGSSYDVCICCPKLFGLRSGYCGGKFRNSNMRDGGTNRIVVPGITNAIILQQLV